MPTDTPLPSFATTPVDLDNVVVFDIETQRTFDEVGGYDHFDKLGVSYVGVYAYKTGQLHGFFEEDLPLLEQIIQREQPTLVGFNSVHFDVPVLQPYFSHFDLSTLPHLDILKAVEVQLGHRVKLDSVAQATLHVGKSASGLDAIRWYREGNFESLAHYCLDDVEVTRDVYEYGLRHGRVFYMTSGQPTPVSASWGMLPTITQQLTQAWKDHRQVVVEYIQGADDQRRITRQQWEIHDFQTETLTVYSHTMNQKQVIELSRVWNIIDLGQTHSHQAQLF